MKLKRSLKLNEKDEKWTSTYDAWQGCSGCRSIMGTFLDNGGKKFYYNPYSQFSTQYLNELYDELMQCCGEEITRDDFFYLTYKLRNYCTSFRKFAVRYFSTACQWFKVCTNE